jgi:hypothetical protein
MNNNCWTQVSELNGLVLNEVEYHKQGGVAKITIKPARSP